VELPPDEQRAVYVVFFMFAALVIKARLHGQVQRRKCYF
jgi:hypothetical protein